MTLEKSKYHDTYLKPDDVCVFHEHDPDLDTITIQLPKLEDFYSKHLGEKVTYDEALMLVDGYGLEHTEQYFRYQEISPKIKNIWQVIARKKNLDIKDVKKEDVYNEIDNNPVYYREEIEQIQMHINRRYIGYWFFNNGKPTYINGWYYFFLNFWKLDLSRAVPFGGKVNQHENLGDYRDKQRRMSLFYEWAYKYTAKRYTYCIKYSINGISDTKYYNNFQTANEFRKTINRTGGVAFIDIGKYIVDDKKNRTIAGVVHPKTRREGYTTFVCCMLFCMVTDTPQKEAFIQALNLKDSVEEVFQKKLVQSIFNLPFFFSPYHDNKNEKPAEDYVFNYPDVMLKLERAGVIPPSLGCSIRTFSSSFRATDGKRGGVILRDECGKVDDKGGFEDIEVQWNNVFKRNLQVGKKLVGFGFFGSTVGDMGGGGGEAFKRLADQSHFRNTSDNGTTASELVNVFFSSFDGMKGFIDKHGFSVIEDPVTPVMGQDGELIFQGAKSYQQNIRDSFLKDGNIQGLINEIREMPFTWKEAWTLSSSSSGLPEKDMMERVGDLTFAKEKTYKRYRLDWTEGLLSDVEIVEDENGDWIISNNFIKHNPSSMLNQKQWDYFGDCWMPSLSVCNRCYEGVDPFAYQDKNTTGKGKKSKGAIAVFWKFDKSIDGEKDFDDRVTEDFVAVFDKRLGDKKLFAEEAAKAAILWGCHTNIESEVQSTIEMFQEWKLDGYMLHHFATDGSMKKVPGVRSQSNKQVMITDMDTFFNRNSKRIQIPQVIDCWLKFTGPASLTDHDLCAATGWAINGIKNPIPEELVEDAGREYFIGLESFDD